MGYAAPALAGGVTPPGVSSALASAGFSVPSNQVSVTTSGGQVQVSVPEPLTLAQQQALDAYVVAQGYRTTYPMTVTAPATAAVNSAATVTADAGDGAFSGDVDFYIGGVLQGAVAAVGGKASLPVTGTATGDVTVTAWVPAYGYASATIQFE